MSLICMRLRFASASTAGGSRVRRAGALAFFVAAALLGCDALAQTGDVFSSGSGESARGAAGGSGGNTTRRTGKQATQDDSVYCQQTPDGRVIPQPYGGTRRNIPCGPAFNKQQQDNRQQP